MTAQEAFLRLGFFKALEDDREILYYRLNKHGELDGAIFFYKNTHMYDNGVQSTVALHIAIDIQIDELGWFQTTEEH